MEAIAIAVIAAIPPTLVALLALRTGRKAERKIEEIHIDINSRMTELLAMTGQVERAGGVADERARRDVDDRERANEGKIP